VQSPQPQTPRESAAGVQECLTHNMPGCAPVQRPQLDHNSTDRDNREWNVSKQNGTSVDLSNNGNHNLCRARSRRRESAAGVQEYLAHNMPGFAPVQGPQPDHNSTDRDNREWNVSKQMWTRGYLK